MTPGSVPRATGRVVVVTGGRTYGDRRRVCEVLDQLHGNVEIGVLVHGGATGADTLADEWARAHGIAVRAYPAEWARFGHAAGPQRNVTMLREADPDLVVAFPGGKGTADLVRRARDRRIELLEVQ